MKEWIEILHEFKVEYLETEILVSNLTDITRLLTK